jgi:hypothetical protein
MLLAPSSRVPERLRRTLRRCTCARDCKTPPTRSAALPRKQVRRGHSSILDCNEEKSDMTYAFNQFCADCRAALKQTPGEAGS